MSYEGFVQLLCPKGHQWTMDCYAWEESDYADQDLAQEGKPPQHTGCPVCGQKAYWINHVNETNGSHDDEGNRIDGYIELEIDKPAVTCKCDKCGITHIVEPETYKIPKSEIGA